MNELLKDLYDSNINKNNFDSLMNEYKNNIDLIVAFLGAGMASAFKDVPDWKGLFDNLYEDFTGSKYLSHDKSDLSNLFSTLFGTLEYANKKAFNEKVFEKVTSELGRYAEPQIEIANTFRCFVTTNYIEPVAHAFRSAKVIRATIPRITDKTELRSFFFKFPSKEERAYSITYLHGCTQIGFCILKEDDYSYFYPSINDNKAGCYVIENTLYKIFTENIVVFLGCSLEPRLKGIMSLVSQEKKPGLPMKMHYWLTDASNIKTLLEEEMKAKSKKIFTKDERMEFETKYFKDYEERYNIKPIIYSTGKHVFVASFCEALRKSYLDHINPPSITYDPCKGGK